MTRYTRKIKKCKVKGNCTRLQTIVNQYINTITSRYRIHEEDKD